MIPVNVKGIEHNIVATLGGVVTPQQTSAPQTPTVVEFKDFELQRLARETNRSDGEYVVDSSKCVIIKLPILKSDSDLPLTSDQDLLIEAINLVDSLGEVPTESRLLITAAIKRRLAATGSNEIFDPETWKPSEKYLDRKPATESTNKENIVEFLERVWAPWIAAGELPLPRLLALDPPGYRAVFTWRKSGNEIPARLNLVTRNEIAAKRIALEQTLPRNEWSARTEWAIRSRRSKLHSTAPG